MKPEIRNSNIISKSIRLLFLVFILPLSIRAQTDTIYISSIKDNTLYQDTLGSFSNGSGAYFFAGKTFQAVNNLRRGLVAFDIAGSVPVGSAIVGAELTLRMSKTISGTFEIGIYRALKKWGEGTSDAVGQEGVGDSSTIDDATWIHNYFDTSLWTNIGGDFIPSPSATDSVAGIGFYTFGTSAQITADVQTWLDFPDSNNGWILIGDESTFASAKRFDARENAISANRPELKIYFIAPPCCIGNRGDVNNDGDDANILDLTFLVDRIFRGGPAPDCLVESDLNNDSTPANILDLTFLVDRIFRGGPAPEPC